MPKFVAPLIGGMAETVGAVTATSLTVGAVSAASLTLTTKLAIAQGGTGASTAAAALTNLGLGGINSAWEQTVLPTGLRGNLGSPSVFEMGMIDAEATNKFWFYPPTQFTVFEESTDDVTWTPRAVNPTTAELQKFVSGNASTAINFAKGKYHRITINAGSYVYLNWLYFYYNTSNAIYIKIEKRNSSTGVWSTVTAYGNGVTSMPGHMFVAHPTIAYSGGTSASHYSAVRITLQCAADTSGGTYPNATLYGMEWWGGYPSGRRTIYSWDEFKNVTFPAAVAAASLTLTTKLAVAQGGTGVATAPVPGGVIYGASAAAYGTTLAGTAGQVLKSAGAGKPTWGALTKSDVGLSNADNTTDLAKPISTAQQAALAGKQGWGSHLDDLNNAGAYTNAFLVGMGSNWTSQTLAATRTILGIQGVYAVASGGTGVSTAPTPGGVIYGANATSFGSTAAGSAGQVLTSAGAGKPTWAPVASVIPPGVIWMYATDTPPPGWLLCDGSAKMIDDYPELYAAIGSVYGGSDLNFFALPDFNHRFPRGSATLPTYGVEIIGGSEYLDYAPTVEGITWDDLARTGESRSYRSIADDSAPPLTWIIPPFTAVCFIIKT